METNADRPSIDIEKGVIPADTHEQRHTRAGELGCRVVAIATKGGDAFGSTIVTYRTPNGNTFSDTEWAELPHTD